MNAFQIRSIERLQSLSNSMVVSKSLKTSYAVNLLLPQVRQILLFACVRNWHLLHTLSFIANTTPLPLNWTEQPPLCSKVVSLFIGLTKVLSRIIE